MYSIPSQYFFRLHQIRPRFKNDVESVLLFVATEISQIGSSAIKDFNDKLFQSIRKYPGNATRKDKTIDNWRTEISALFGLIEEDHLCNIAQASKMAEKLASEQDLVEFFKYFLFYFQYPGGHIKTHKLKQVIDIGIKFKPAKYILSVLASGEEATQKRFAINKAEATHFIYNDLRITRDNQSPNITAKIIFENRTNKTQLDWRGDSIRYAGDILDYMVLANLLVAHGGDYYLNLNEKEAITSFCTSSEWFDGYDHLFNTAFNVSELSRYEDQWFKYVNKELNQNLFQTNIFKYLNIEDSSQQLEYEFDHDNINNTKEIGDFGEHLIFGHECTRVKEGGRIDLIHLIKKIPTSLAVGYDIQSVELNEKKRYIEVKTTVSNKNLNFYNFHLTPNEWNTAESIKDRYFVYRLMVSKESRKLFIIQDPVNLYKNDIIDMSLKNGANIIFNEKCGEWAELLIWQN